MGRSGRGASLVTGLIERMMAVLLAVRVCCKGLARRRLSRWRDVVLGMSRGLSSSWSYGVHARSRGVRHAHLLR
jgi:hypothetical protein